MKAVSVALLNSVGAGLTAGNWVSEFEGLEILECTPVGDQFFLMVDGPWPAIEKFHNRLKIEFKPLKERSFEKLNPRVLAAHRALENALMQNYVYVVEGDFIGDIFAAADVMFALGAACIDLRMARGASRNSYALMTSISKLNLMDLDHVLSVKITMIHPVQKSLRNFFDLQPDKV